MTSDPPVMYTTRTHPPEVGTVIEAMGIVFGELWKRWRAGRCSHPAGGGLYIGRYSGLLWGPHKTKKTKTPFFPTQGELSLDSFTLDLSLI